MSTKEDTRDPSGKRSVKRTEPERVSRLRERAKQAGESRRASFKRLEAQLAERLQVLSEQIAREQAACDEREAALSQRAAQLEEQAAEANHLRDDAQVRLAQGEARLAERKTQFDRQAAELREREAACAKREKELTELARRQAATRDQRRRLARELRAQRSRLLAEIEQERARLAQFSAAEESQLHRQLADQMAECSLLREELAKEERRREDLEDRLTEAQAAAPADNDHGHELDELRGQITRLRERLAEAEERRGEAERRRAEAERSLQEAAAAEPADSEELLDVRRRCELALQDLRDLKDRNAELERELAAAKRAAETRGDSRAAIVGSDWESQKRRLMQELDEDFDPKDPRQGKDRLTIETAIRTTEQIVAEKEKEIQELQRLLDDQSSNIGGLAVGATAIAAVLDQDELIREEREAVKRLQDEWREKVRQAEVDISLERAKLARERTELEEKMRHLSALASEEAATTDPGSGRTKKTRRWLSLLMKEGEDTP